MEYEIFKNQTVEAYFGKRTPVVFKVKGLFENSIEDELIFKNAVVDIYGVRGECRGGSLNSKVSFKESELIGICLLKLS